MPKLIVAGIPRCGTTMVWYAVQGMTARSRMPKSYSSATHDILKTHRSPPASYHGKAIFLFGDPVLAVISTRRSRWDHKHFRNCGCHRDPANTNIYTHDWLGYEALFDSWMRRQDFDTIAVRYESIHTHAAVIEEFLDVGLFLPTRARRRTKHDDVPPRVLDRIMITYAGLIAKVERAPDVSIWSGRTTRGA